jgi:hypothetical protein
MPTDRWIELKYLVCIHNGVLVSHKEEQNYVISRKMDATGDHHIKWNKLDWERQISFFFFYAESRFLRTWK